MPLYMDRHKVGLETTPEDVAAAHALDQQVEEKYGVKYLTYWFDRSNGGIFCLAQAPSKEAAIRVHAEAHGLLAEDLIEVEEGPVAEYLGRTTDPPVTPIADSAFRTIVFTDIVGSTPLTQRLGDDGMMHLLREHNQIVRDALSGHSGREVKHTGDGIMACFQSVAHALESTIAVQRATFERNQARGEEAVEVRVGLSAGEPVEDGGDLFGAVVQLARRICDAADPGSILTSNVVRELAIGKRFTFRDRGDTQLKGFADPIRLHELHWHPD